MLEILTRIQVRKPVPEVFDAIVSPLKMTGYFISASSGPLEEGKTVYWEFPEFPGSYPVEGKKIRHPDYISFTWDTDGNQLLVEIKLESRENDSTLVTVTEKGMENTEAGIKWLKGNTEGWANFLACLKAWLEYGINLRTGGFDFLKEQ